MSYHFLAQAHHALASPILSDLTASGGRVLCVIAEISRDDPEDPLFAKSWLTHQQIAHRAGCSVSAVRREIKKLEAHRVIAIDREDPDSPGRWQYYFQIDRVEQIAAHAKAHIAILDADNRAREKQRKQAYRDKKRSEHRQKELKDSLAEDNSTAVDKPKYLRVVS